MTDKLYTQKEVDDIQGLAQAAALKEAAESLFENRLAALRSEPAGKEKKHA